MSLFPDHPISEPSFNFDKLGWALAELALNERNPTPFTVVVRGAWGRGKTTLLRRTERWLKEYGDVENPEKGCRRVKTLWFNAWKYPDTDTVLAGLIGALLTELRDGPFFDKLKAQVRDKGATGTLWLLGRVFPLIFEKGGEISPPEGGTWLPPGRFGIAEQKQAFYDSFTRIFQELTHIWFAPAREAFKPGSGEPLDDTKNVVTVFLDDLDRCPDERIVEALEAMILFLDFPGVCFYLGLDWNRLVEVLANTYGDRAEHYLEKMFQIGVDLPEAPADRVEGYIRGLVRGTSLEALLRDQESTVAASLRSRDPRHVKRFLNDLSVRLGLLWHTDQLEVGDGAKTAESPRISEKAVLAWHLLHEQVPGPEWREETSNLGNLDGLLRKYEGKFTEVLSKEQPDAGVGGRPGGEDMDFARRMASHMRVLVDLDHARRSILLYLASPARPSVKGPPASLAKEAAGPERPRGGPVPEIFGRRDEDLWVSLEGGAFKMGSADIDDAREHERALSGFRILRYPVTNAQYAVYVQETDAKPPSHWKEGVIPKGKEYHPVVNVSWSSAGAFCAWWTKKLGGPGNGEIQLPTEGQWEYAARGVDGRIYPWGGVEPTKERANFGMNVGDTTPVDAYPEGKTPEGVSDMAGNVWEWCRDWYAPYPDEVPRDWAGPERGEFRVLRGGAFYDGPNYLRAACRNYGPPVIEYNFIGFRCVWLGAGGQ